MDRRRNRFRPLRAFTLLEVLVALVIFGVITVAVSFTFDTALKTQVANTRRLEELAAVRSVFDYMTRDVQQAYASSNSAAAAFIATGGQSGPRGASGGGLLTLMTRGNRVLMDPQGAATSTGSGPVSSTTSLPQSETAMVRYDFDGQARTLSRSSVAVPNLQSIQQAAPGPDDVICSRVDDISLRFWDPTAQSWRSDWDYEQQNQQASTTGQPGANGAGASGAAAAPANPTSVTSTATGDTTLPGMVEVTVTIRHQDGTTATYVSTITLVTSQVADGMAPPVNTGTTTAAGAGTGK